MYEAKFQPISNRADWFGTIELVDDTTNSVISDLTGVTVKIELRSSSLAGPRGYGSAHDWFGSHCRVLTASTEDGRVQMIAGGVIQWHFTASEMHGLSAGTYEIGILIVRLGITMQELIGVVPIVDGIVRS